MGKFTRKAFGDFVNRTVLDSTGLIVDGPVSGVALSPDKDEFNIVFNHWTSMSGTQILSAWPGTNGGTITEAAGKHTYNLGNPPQAIGRRRDITYSNADIVFYCNDCNAVVKASTSLTGMALWLSQDNFVEIFYRAQRPAGSQTIQAYKIINGASTLLGESADQGSQADMWFNIQRVAITNTFNLQYALTNPVAARGGNPANWVSLFNGIVYDATHFNYAHLLYPIHFSYNNNPTFFPVYDYYDQQVANRYVVDTATCDVINSDDGAVEYAFHAGVGKKWYLKGIEAVMTALGASSLLFKGGYSDNGLFAGATYDPAYITIAQLNTNAKSKAYNGHEYLHFKVQLADATSINQPLLEELSILGSTDKTNYYSRRRRLKYGMSRIR